ncbi:MAG: hypothetical protein OZ923_03935 [Comamonadaceae bacterium]|nr:hypothetical protein [Comamonadaceae bacterium]
MPSMPQPHHETKYNDCAQLLVHAWRMTMVHGIDCPLIAQQFRCSCGADGREVFRAFCTFLCALALAQRRCLTVNPPGRYALTTDEVRMLTLIAAAQNDCPCTLDAHLAWLSWRPLRQTLKESVRELAGLLSTSGQHLPVPV